MSTVTKEHVYPSSLKRIEPQPGQESVWDYPKPPSYHPVANHIRIEFNGEIIAETDRAIRNLQTGIPPVYYIPREDVRIDWLTPTERHSHCRYKGDADYWTVQVGERTASNIAWSYPDPLPEAMSIKDYVAFYAHVVEATVDGEKVEPPVWKWIGGWVTANIVGPFMTQDDNPNPQVKTLQEIKKWICFVELNADIARFRSIKN